MQYDREIIRIVEQKYEGLFLGEEIRGTKEKNKWKCKFGHEFEKTLERITQGEWCPVCSQGKSERFCRFCFEEIFRQQFPKRKNLEWLRNLAGAKLELDGYNDNLKIAFEYQGRQHSEHIEHFQRTPERFSKQKADDETKKKLCQTNGVFLVEVPYTVTTEKMEAYIRSHVGEYYLGELHSIDYSKYRFLGDDKLEEIKEIAISRNGKCFSDHYVDSQSKLRFYCNIHDYEWQAAAYSVKAGRWCKLCGYSKSKAKDERVWNIADYKDFALRMGGKCLSETLSSSNDEMVWKCSNPDHAPYRAKASSVRIGKYLGCMMCSKKTRITIEDMILHARMHNGRCLSAGLPNRGKTLVEFECIHFPEHKRFFKKATEIMIDSSLWCPRCDGGKIQKHDLAEIRSIAVQHGYQCLSESYLNNHEVMLWRCTKCAFEWKENFRGIQRKIKNRASWCDKCEMIEKLDKIG